MILECTRCEALVNAELLSSYQLEDEKLGTITYCFLKCPRCEKPFLADDDQYFGPIRLYPPLDDRVNPNLPKQLKAAYREAVACFKSKAYSYGYNVQENP